jgi:hypothetical protein
MLLRRIENGNVVEALYESSNIVASKYDKTTNQLKLIFKGGVEYIYEGVKVTDYHKLELADSQGKAFNKYLRSYQFVKGDKVDINEIFTRIEEVKEEEILDITRHIAELGKLIHNKFEEDGEITESMLGDMTRMIKLREDRLK